MQRRQPTCARLNVHVIPQLFCGACRNVANASSGENKEQELEEKVVETSSTTSHTCTLVDSGQVGVQGWRVTGNHVEKEMRGRPLVDFLCELEDKMFCKLR